MEKKNLFENNFEEAKKRIDKSDHGKFIKNICRVLIKNTEKKCNTVWIQGVPNSGKSTFLELLGDIFPSCDYK